MSVRCLVNFVKDGQPPKEYLFATPPRAGELVVLPSNAFPSRIAVVYHHIQEPDARAEPYTQVHLENKE